MADTFEEVAALKGERVTFQAEDGKPVTGVILEVDATARTVTLADKRVVKFHAVAKIEKPVTATFTK
jgi:hypothetical protein